MTMTYDDLLEAQATAEGMPERQDPDALYECPWGCPINIFPEDVDYHRQWHSDQGENPDVRGKMLVQS